MGRELDGPKGPEQSPLDLQWERIIAQWEMLRQSHAVDALRDIHWDIVWDQKTAEMELNIWTSWRAEVGERAKRYFDFRGSCVSEPLDPADPSMDPLIGIHLFYNKFDLIPLRRHRQLGEREEQVEYIAARALPDRRLHIFHERFISNRHGRVARVRSNEEKLIEGEWRQQGLVENKLQDIYTAHQATK